MRSCVEKLLHFTLRIATPCTLNGNSKILHFEHSDTIEIHDRILFVFYPGQSHVLVINS